MVIKDIIGSEILDSRGNPTIRVTVTLANGVSGTASVPSGASTGIHEALELRDNDPRRYGGKGVLKAIRNINSALAGEVRGLDVRRQRLIDRRLCAVDGTPNKSHLGANAILGVSLACAHAAAVALKMPLYRSLRLVFALSYPSFRMPYPMMNIENGGAHAGWILDFQEFMIVPRQKSFSRRVQCGSEVFHALGTLLRKRGFSTLVGDEGGYAILFEKNEDALRMIVKAIAAAGYTPGTDVVLALDPATSEFFKMKKYELKRDHANLSTRQMIALWERWIKKYPIISIEDGLAEDDWDGWQAMTALLGKKVMLVGDDFFVTDAKRLQLGIDRRCANAILIKPNQIGTLTETIDCVQLAQQSGYKVVISHRSGETVDTTIADLAVAVRADYIKTGSLSRSERVEKYNRLMEIERELKL
ncbi:phosphopyruvate hydratase [Candidatus Uhrbacteria bacterium]|nr:phosphopyruvate hydratase [Candidatus Uhrbacteria bacterium]